MLRDDLRSHFDSRADDTFGLSHDANVLGIVSSLSPQVVILEIGTNDLTRLRPEFTGSEIEELLRLLLDTFSVRLIGVCEVLPRARAPFFNDAALILNHYLGCLLYTSPSPRDLSTSRMPSSA